MYQTLNQAIEALLTGASFNFDEGNTRALIANVQNQLSGYRQVAPTTFYYDISSGSMKKSRRTCNRNREPVPH